MPRSFAVVACVLYALSGRADAEPDGPVPNGDPAAADVPARVGPGIAPRSPDAGRATAPQKADAGRPLRDAGPRAATGGPDEPRRDAPASSTPGGISPPRRFPVDEAARYFRPASARRAGVLGGPPPVRLPSPDLVSTDAGERPDVPAQPAGRSARSPRPIDPGADRASPEFNAPDPFAPPSPPE